MSVIDLFRGYVRTKGKRCIDDFKGIKELRTYEDVKNLNEFAGILDYNVALIDIDDKEESEILFSIIEEKNIKCKVMKTTKGMHFFFKNEQRIQKCKTKTNLFIGIKADIKLGSRNSYSVLKIDGKQREVLRDSQEYEPVPKWLLPTNYDMSFVFMDEGDGRNQALFNFILILQANDFSKSEARECIKLINDFTMLNPLPDDEINVILRDESFKKEIFFNKNTFLFDKFAMFIKNSKNIKRINNKLHIYKKGIYVENSEEIERSMIINIPTLSKSKRREVLEYLNLIVEEEYEGINQNFIAFRNGVYDLNSKKIFDYNPEIILRNKINFDYNPNAYDELMDETLNNLSCNDTQIRALIEEMVGYCFYPLNELGKAFILVGDKSNGKSTLLALITHILGAKNISSLDLGELGERFKTAELFNKLANIGDDIGDEFVANPSLFKKLVTGDRINAERKGQDPFEFNNYSKFIFSANEMPRIKDPTGAVQRRLIIIPFNAVFDKNDTSFDPYIKYKLKEISPTEYLIKLGIEGLQRILENKGFTKSDKVIKELEEYEKMNNPILLFFEEYEREYFLTNSTDDIYKNYTLFCSENNFQPLSKMSFSKKVCLQFKLKSKPKKLNGKVFRIYVEKD